MAFVRESLTIPGEAGGPIPSVVAFDGANIWVANLGAGSVSKR